MLALVVGRAAGRGSGRRARPARTARSPTARAGRPAGRRSGRRRGPSARPPRGASPRRRSGGRRSRATSTCSQPGGRQVARRATRRPAGSRRRAPGAPRCSGSAGTRGSASRRRPAVASRYASTVGDGTAVTARSPLAGPDRRVRRRLSAAGRAADGGPDAAPTGGAGAPACGRTRLCGVRPAGPAAPRPAPSASCGMTPWIGSFGGRSAKSFSNSSASTVSSATSFSASWSSLSRCGRQDVRGPGVGAVDDRPDLLVDLAARRRPSSCAARRSRGRGRPARRACRRHSGPSWSLMPNSVTIRRARSVAFSMSLLAPVVVSPKTSRSAALPPSRPAILSSNSVLLWR